MVKALDKVMRLWERWRNSVPGQIITRQGDLHLDLIAAGLAFYGLLALFPGLVATVSLFGLIADPAVVQQKIQPLSQIVPPAAWTIIDRRMGEVTSAAPAALTFSAVTALLITLWSTTRGMRATINSLNLIHGVSDRRNPVVQNLVAYGLTVLTVLMGVFAVLVILGTPLILRVAGFGSLAAWIAALLPWPVLMAAAVGALVAVYKLAPARNRLPVRRVAKAALGVTAVWIPISLLFTAYVGSFGSFNATYGSLGAVVILLLWFFVSARIVLLGAVWNTLPLTAAEKEAEEEAPAPSHPDMGAGI